MIHTDKIFLETDGIRIAIKNSYIAGIKDPNMPIIVLTPGMNRTMKDYFIYASYFAANGFRVIRFDNINHPGLSTGEIFEYTLTDSLYCMDKVLTYIKDLYPHADLSILASSIMGRVVIKHISKNSEYKHVGLLIPVVNLEKSVKEITGELLYEMERNNIRRDHFEIFDQTISWKCIQDGVINNYDSFDTTLNDLSTTEQNVSVFIVKEDPWVNFEEVNNAFSNLSSCSHISILNGSSHELGRNITALKILLKEVVERFNTVQFSNGHPAVVPNFQDVIKWSKFDRSLNFHNEAKVAYAG